MFASRTHNENAIYEQQTAAAAKPLNQGVKGLAPKTPSNKAPKTPFKVPLNDENAALANGKTGGKGKQAGLFGDGKGGKPDAPAFVTPAGPRTRAPLGNKTTNVKATAHQTPAPPTQEKPSTKPSSPRMRRAKVKVQEAEVATADDEEAEREIEYMPPREIPLPDYPDDWPHDRTYPQFEGKNLTRGWWSEFGPQKADDDDEFSDFEQKLKRIEELNAKKKQQVAQAKKPTTAKQNPLTKTTRDPLTVKPPQTLRTKSAASALSNKTGVVPSFAAPAKTRLPSAPASKKSTNVTTAAGNTRHTAAKVASNSTLGYSKGRAVSAATRPPFTGTRERHLLVNENVKPSPIKAASDGPVSLDELFGLQDLSLGDSLDPEVGDSGEESPHDLADEDDELQDFQLQPMEL